MNKWYKSGWMKVLLVLQILILTVLAVVSGTGLYFMMETGVDPLNPTVEYGSTRQFARQLYFDSDELLFYVNEERKDPSLEGSFERDSNIIYLYADMDRRKVYTNRKEYGSFADLESSVKEIAGEEEHYVCIYPQISRCSAGISTDFYSLEDWRMMVEAKCPAEDYVYVVSVDFTFPVTDDYSQYAEIYGYLSGLGVIPLIVLVVSILLFLGALVWLTIIAGRSDKDGEVHLNRFDQWYTELGASSVIAVWMLVVTGIILLFQFAESYSYHFGENVYRNMAGITVLAAIAGIANVAVLLTGYLSLVRRIKAGTLWKNSLCKKLCHGLARLLRQGWQLAGTFFTGLGIHGGGFLGACSRKLQSAGKAVGQFFGQIMGNLGTSVKVALGAGGFLLVQLVVIPLVFMSDSPFFFFLVLVIVDGLFVLFALGKANGQMQIMTGLKKMAEGELHYKIPLDHLRGNQKKMAEYINNMGEGLDRAVESSLRSERMKTELITNVSHDLKNPLTSIISYVDLLKRENIEDPKIRGYLDVLDEKAQRLKVLTEDVVEASKASSGSITLNLEDLDFVELVNQVAGDFQEKWQQRGLQMVTRLSPEPVIIRADGRRMWRVLENIFNNVWKYALEGTRVYVELDRKEVSMVFTLKNISQEQLNISPDELTERFIRGDASRNTEGSGLGLSIARSLTELQGGSFEVGVDGDLFKVTITFQVVKKEDLGKETPDETLS